MRSKPVLLAALTCLVLRVALYNVTSWQQQPIIPQAVFLSVIIPTFRKPEALARCLEGFAIQRLDHTLFSVIVVDDAHDPVTAHVVERFVNRVDVVMIQHVSNAGVGAARQTGLLAATGKVIVSYDDDQVPDSAFLLEIYRFHKEHPGLEVAMLSLLKWPQEILVNPLLHYATWLRGTMWSFNGLTSGQVLPFGKLWAGCSSFKRAFAMKVGGYNARLRWAEDTDLELRLQEEGLSVIYHPQAFSWATKVPSNYEDVARRSRGAGNAICTLLLLHRNSQQFEKIVSLLTNGIQRLSRQQFQQQQHRMIRVHRALQELDCPSGTLCGVDCNKTDCGQLGSLSEFYGLLDETVTFSINAGIKSTGLRWRFLTTTPSDWGSFTAKIMLGSSMPEVFDQQWTRLESKGLWPRRTVSPSDVAWAYRCIMLRDPLPQETWDAQARFEHKSQLSAALILHLEDPASLVPHAGYREYKGLSQRRVVKEEYTQLYTMILGRQPSTADLRELLPKTKTLNFTFVRAHLLSQRALEADTFRGFHEENTVWSPRKQFMLSRDE